MMSDSAARIPYDPVSGVLPDELRALGGELGRGRVVALATPSSAAAGGWRARTAVALARGWSRVTSRLFLMDLCLENPVLHYFLGEPNGEGVADVFAFGASLERVARPVEGGEFFFAPAGTAVSEPRQVLAHRRWEGLVRGFREATATLVIYVPLELEGADTILDRADHVVLLDGEEVGAAAWREKLVAHLESSGAPTGSSPSEPSALAESGGGGTPSEPPEPTEERPVVEIAALAPDPLPASGDGPREAGAVPVGELAPEPAPTPEGPGVGPVVEIGELAPVPAVAPAREGEPVVPVGELAPEPAATPEGPVVPVGELAPERPAAAPQPVVEIGELAPEPTATPAPAGEEAPRPPEEAADLPGAPPPAMEEASPPPEEEAEAEPSLAAGEPGGVAPEEPPAPPVAEETGVPAADEPGDGAAGGPHPAFEPAEEPGGLAGEGEEPAVVEEGPSPAGEATEEPGAPAADDVEAAVEEEAFGATARSEPGGSGAEPDGAAGGAATEEEAAAGEGAAGVEPVGPESAAPGEAPEATDASEQPGSDEFDLDALDALVAEGARGEESPPGAADEGADGGASAPEEGAGEAGPGAAPGPSDAREGGATVGFGEDLVTGPDFGGPAQGDEWERGSAESGRRSPGAVAGDRPAAGGRERRGAEEARGEAPRRPRPDRRRRRPSSEPSEEPRRSRIVPLLGLLLLVAIGAVAGHWYRVVRVPGMDRALASVLGPAYTGMPPSVDNSGPQPTSPVLSHSLALDSYRDVATVQDVAAALRERLPDLLFVVAPFQEDGEVFYRLLVGPATSAEEGRGLRSPISGILNREDSDRWTVRTTPLAFLVYETGTASAAGDRVEEIEAAGIPAYYLRVVYPDERENFRVYSGAYGGPEEARALQGMLAAEGYADVTFTERRGRLPE